MTIDRLWLTDFRNHRDVDLSFDEGVTLVSGPNGQGKTNLLEAVAWLARGSSFRSAPTEALVREGSEAAVIRAEVSNQGRTVLLEAELSLGGRSRIQVNRQRVSRVRDMLGHFRATVFSPDDLVLVKGGPSERRRWIDDLLVDLHPRNHGLRSDFEKVLRQRNALLKQARGRLTSDIGSTLDVWDSKMVEVGESLASSRKEVLESLGPLVSELSSVLADGKALLSATVLDNWSSEGLALALKRSRNEDLKRGLTTTGPHRDDVNFILNDMPARTHGSQGEQRTLALALRLAGHRLVADQTGLEPVVLLDDVFSELDQHRSAGLISVLPNTQAVLTTAGLAPKGVCVGNVLHLGNEPIDMSESNR